MAVVVLQGVIWTASLILLVVGAGFDVTRRVIPNVIALGVAGAGVALALVSRPGSLWQSLLIAAALYIALAALVHRGLMGGGDLKLIVAASLLVPPDRVAALLASIVVAGGLLSAVYLIAYAALKSSPATAPAVHSRHPFRRLLAAERRRIVAARSVPYGVAILGGVAIHVLREFPACWSGTSCSL